MRLPATLLASMVVAAAIGCGGEPPVPAAARQAPAERWPDDARHTLDLRYDARALSLSGTQRIDFANTGPEPLRAVWLRAWANAYGGCARGRARVAVVAGGRLGERRQDCTALEVRLAEPLAPGARAAITLRLRVTVPSGSDRFGRNRGAAYFGNALPVLAVADRGGWRLPAYTFAGESFYSLTSSWRARVRLPRGRRVASTGAQVGGAGRTVTLAAPRARDFMLAIGPFRVTSRRAGTVTVRHFRLPGTPVVQARRALATASLSLRRFARWYGPYARSELDVVESTGRLGRGGIAMEYPELILTPPDPSAVAHEVAHQWFYAIVGNDQFREPWLDESFAEFTASRLPPAQVPNRLGDCRPPPGRGGPPLDSDMARLTGGARGAYVRVVYVGGACMLRGLQATLGARAFDAFARRLVASHRDGVLTTTAFVAMLHAAAPDDAAVDRVMRRFGLDVP